MIACSQHSLCAVAGGAAPRGRGAAPGGGAADAGPGRGAGRARCAGAAALWAALWAAVALVLLLPLSPLPGGGGVARAQAPGADGTLAPPAPWRLAATLAHDSGAFTQGLFFAGGRLFETTGLRGASRIMELDPASGRELRRAELPARFFGEGATAVDGAAVWLTWTSGRAFVLGLDDFAPRGSFAYSGQGWGLTGHGGLLYMSDGSDTLTLRDARTFAELGRVAVRDGGRPVELLNELEWVEGEIFANVWRSSRVAVIDPPTGRVRRWLDLGPLVPPGLGPEAVANGLAWNPATRRLYVTGKRWPVMYVLEPGPATP